MWFLPHNRALACWLAPQVWAEEDHRNKQQVSGPERRSSTVSGIACTPWILSPSQAGAQLLLVTERQKASQGTSDLRAAM